MTRGRVQTSRRRGVAARRWPQAPRLGPYSCSSVGPVRRLGRKPRMDPGLSPLTFGASHLRPSRWCLRRFGSKQQPRQCCSDAFVRKSPGAIRQPGEERDGYATDLRDESDCRRSHVALTPAVRTVALPLTLAGIAHHSRAKRTPRWGQRAQTVPPRRRPRLVAEGSPTWVHVGDLEQQAAVTVSLPASLSALVPGPKLRRAPGR